jgi:hypothetical protein
MILELMALSPHFSWFVSVLSQDNSMRKGAEQSEAKLIPTCAFVRKCGADCDAITGTQASQRKRRN